MEECFFISLHCYFLKKYMSEFRKLKFYLSLRYSTSRCTSTGTGAKIVCKIHEQHTEIDFQSGIQSISNLFNPKLKIDRILDSISSNIP